MNTNFQKISIALVFAIGLAIMLSGCASRHLTVIGPSDASQSHLTDQSANIQQATTGSTNAAQDIAAKATEGAAAYPDLTADYWSFIREKSLSIVQWMEVAARSQANLGDVKKTYDSQLSVKDAEIAQLKAENERITSDQNRMLLTAIRAAGFAGLLILAGGAAMMFAPIAGLKSWAFMVLIFGGALAGASFLIGPLMVGYIKVAPWLVYCIVGCIGAVVMTLTTLVIIRLIRNERATGNDAQDKLIAKGESQAAAALAFAKTFVETGDAGKAWESAKIIEHDNTSVSTPTAAKTAGA